MTPAVEVIIAWVVWFLIGRILIKGLVAIEKNEKVSKKLKRLYMLFICIAQVVMIVIFYFCFFSKLRR
ncbi:hypothetical protein [Lachnobacterium bovis]|uniref:hypothetical protein n=1 Tax=Lachnobacterium bovis TaxID=140626 RepID=UPI0003B4054F|nr:hypothetical protein [Lachnobacterium bovis]